MENIVDESKKPFKEMTLTEKKEAINWRIVKEEEMMKAGQITKGMEEYFDRCDEQYEKDYRKTDSLFDRISKGKLKKGTVRFVRKVKIND